MLTLYPRGWERRPTRGAKSTKRFSTCAKLQILSSRCKSGGIGELVGSCPPLTDKNMTNGEKSRLNPLGTFKKD